MAVVEPCCPLRARRNIVAKPNNANPKVLLAQPKARSTHNSLYCCAQLT